MIRCEFYSANLESMAENIRQQRQGSLQQTCFNLVKDDEGHSEDTNINEDMFMKLN